MPQACVTCRQRKVRCDEKSPCSGCIKFGRDCIRPARMPRRNSRPQREQREELLQKRLHKLESVVDSLRSSIQSGQIDSDRPELDSASPEDEHAITNESKSVRLLIGNGKSRYVSDRFWASLTAEIEDVSSMLAETSDDRGESGVSSLGGNELRVPGFLFPQYFTEDLAAFYPPKALLPTFWQLFVTNIDPMVRILHKPTTESVFFRTGENPNGALTSEEALFFAICFAVVTSMSEDEVETITGEQKEVLTRRYTCALQSAMSQAEILDTQELVVLQALVLFLTCLQCHQDSQSVWTISGLAIRIAEAMGLHRDGDIFRLPPFETELRRRLWWTVYMLDIRVSERQGFNSKILEESFDTKMPLNINDADITPDAVTHPIERTECTESSFVLLRYMTSTAMQYVRNPRYSLKGRDISMGRQTFAERKRRIEECERQIREDYLGNCTHGTTYCRFTAGVRKVIVAKMWLELYHPLHSPKDTGPLSQEIRNFLFTSAVESIEDCWRIQIARETLKWSWTSRSYVQWHSVAFVLAELCHREESFETGRAWRAVEMIFEHWSEMAEEKRNPLRWKPLQLLRQKAGRKRRANAMDKHEEPPILEETLRNRSSVTNQTKGLNHPTKYSFGSGNMGSDAVIFPSEKSGEVVNSLLPQNHNQIVKDYAYSELPERYKHVPNKTNQSFVSASIPAATFSEIGANGTDGLEYLTSEQWTRVLQDIDADIDYTDFYSTQQTMGSNGFW